ncbi:MAG TPA: hypothetical protein VMC80_00290 [Patescibacteria group bacterium]|nr:hypothetical protein [Patescibacteria group bacterium]
MSDIGEEVLGICMWEDEVTKEKCGRIRIDTPNNKWLKREEDPVSYDAIYKKYNDNFKLSHGYCPEHEEMIKKKYGLK